ncbi:MAG: 50S ribosomal protein L23 [Alphaproteobacteria bacterium]|nr:50S ribosomal protein L23 [Alphaproteobacteria bacterium]
MISEYDCLVVPVMTEKSMNSKEGVHVFKVNTKATKLDITRAVEKVFKVKVAKVNVLNRKGKKKTFRGRAGETKATKIAIVRLSEGVINFEGGI